MGLRIDKTGWTLIFLVGAALVIYSLHRHGAPDLRRWFGPPMAGKATAPPDPAPAELYTLRVRLSARAGCLGGLVANGGRETAPGSLYANKGLNVYFQFTDAPDEGAAALAAGAADVLLTTVDAWARDQEQFVRRNISARAFFLASWSCGADSVIAREGIRRLEDLAGKRIALAPSTPSHFLLWTGLQNSLLSIEQRGEIFAKAVHAKDGAEPARLLAQGAVDAAVLGEPAVSQALARCPGARKIYDSRGAGRLLADLLVVSDRHAARAPQTLVRFLEGWLEGVESIRVQPDRAHVLIGRIEEFNIPEGAAQSVLEGVQLANYADNVAFFGTPGGPSDYANTFRLAEQMYRELGQIRRATDPEATLDRRYLDALRGGSRGPGPKHPFGSAGD